MTCLKYHLTNIALGVALLATAFYVTSSVSAGEITVASGGQSPYVIVVPAEPSAMQSAAAQELQTFFEEVSDAKLPIVSETTIEGSDLCETVTSGRFFLIGPSELTKAVLGEKPEAEIGYDGIIVKSVGSSVVLSGSVKRGALYAVYEFLESQLGCRWWTSTESTIPHTPELSIADDLNVYYAPKLIYRESYYRDARKSPFAARMRCNGSGEPIPPEFGDHHVFQYFVHSSYPLIPPEKYFLDHPDWFSEIDGVRKVGVPGWSGSSDTYRKLVEQLKPEQIHASGAQLCFSNDEMLEELTKNAREALRKNPNASFLSISQNDWHGYCTCEKCRAIDEEEGSHAASLLRGVNKVAEALEDEFPDLYVETLAYQYTRKPPKTLRPRHNVVIRLCSIECSFGQPLDSDANSTFRDDLVGWSKLADNLFVWDYATDFALYLLPFPNYHVLAPNINFYINHNVIGFFEQGDYQCETGDFVQLRNWVVSKLLWDPSLDPKALRDEFVAGYYAPELVPIYREYFDALIEAVVSKNYYLSIYRRSAGDWMDVYTLSHVTRLQRQASEIAERLEKENPEKYKGLCDKVSREQIPLDLVWLQEYRHAKLECQLRDIEFLGPEDPLEAARAFVRKLDKFGLTRSRESDSPEQFKQFKEEFIQRYEDYQTAEASVPKECEGISNKSWIDLQEYDFTKSRFNDWTFLAEDPSASNKRAVMMPGNHFEWATAWSIASFLNSLEPTGERNDEEPVYHVYAYVRCEATAKDGPAMTLGVYDEKEKKGVTHRSVTVEQINGSDYVCIDLGSLPLRTSQYAWFAPPKRPGEVQKVFIDRLVIIREH
ncbi:MAG: DUF4838 domain-containing protein [Planctomycetia bacterium]|nr:DUF4838 domain-containing protein [Planctomycetia bacterium]